MLAMFSCLVTLVRQAGSAHGDQGWKGARAAGTRSRAVLREIVPRDEL